jgi:hypothetical protein
MRRSRDLFRAIVLSGISVVGVPSCASSRTPHGDASAGGDAARADASNDGASAPVADASGDAASVPVADASGDAAHPDLDDAAVEEDSGMVLIL